LRGAEALLRWRHPELGMIPPSKFIPIAEQTGLIVALGEWVLDAACRFLHRSDYLDRGNIALAVNVSVLQLQQRDYVDRVAATLARYNVPAGALELEVTESICVDDIGTVSAMFQRLRSLGIRLAIDDFGTGYSSMNYLRHLGVDTIKIDSSFVRDIPGDPFSCAISDAITRMAHSLNCKVLAEGVETEAQLVHLQQLGCDNAQGYHFARPMSLEEFERWCRVHHPPPCTSAPAVAVG
jgi:EAL domain-containing protein (putative c-di-GMP-specific phosphodiesterase class I)